METKKTGITYRKETDSENAPWQQFSNIDELIWDGIYLLNVINDDGSHNMPFRITDTDTVTLVVKDHALGEARTVVQTITRVERSSGKEFIYTRTRCNTCGEHVWSEWTETHKNIELGEVNSFDIYTESGNYSGVYTNGNVCENFSMVVIDNKAVASAKGDVRSVSQFKYSLNLDGTFSFKTRIGHGNESVTWNSWVDIGAADTTDIQDNSITAQKLSIDVRENLGKVSEMANCIQEVESDINSRLGFNKETITLKSSELLPVLWNGTKMISSTVYNTWIVPLNKGRTYKCTNISYIYSRRTCNEYPTLGKELVMPVANGLDSGTFVATDETRYLVITVQTDKYDSSNYEVTAYGYGLVDNFNDIESRVSTVEETTKGTDKEFVQLKKDLHSRFGSNDRTIVLRSSDFDNIVWNGTEFSETDSVTYNGFIVPIQAGERIKYMVDEYANNLRTTTEYPAEGSTNFVRTSTELNGDFIAQENEFYLFINAYIPEFTGYEVIIGEGAINKRTISTFETSATRDSIGIVGKNDTEEIIFESKIPAATTESAGIMSSEDKLRAEDVYERLHNLEGILGSSRQTIELTPERFDNILWNGTAFRPSSENYNGFLIRIIPGQRVLYSASQANNARTLTDYPSIGSISFVRTGDELNGDFIAQENERYLFLNVTVETFSFYTVTFEPIGVAGKTDYLTNISFPIKGKTIVCFGDSMTEKNDANGKNWADYMAEISEANIVKAGVGGTQLATRELPVETPTNYLPAYGAVDISNLVKAWVNNDWDIVDNAVTWLAENRNDNNGEQIERLKANPIEKTDIVIVFGGTNDCANSTFGSPNDTNPIKNTCGGINQIINSILAVKPDMPIYFFNPLPRMVNGTWSDEYRAGETDSYGGLDFPSLTKRIKECVESRHFPCCDLYYSIGINRDNIYTFASDGVHVVGAFRKLANKIYSFITANRIWN